MMPMTSDTIKTVAGQNPPGIMYISAYPAIRMPLLMKLIV